MRVEVGRQEEEEEEEEEEELLCAAYTKLKPTSATSNCWCFFPNQRKSIAKRELHLVEQCLLSAVRR